jgi:hypothetical protein
LAQALASSFNFQGRVKKTFYLLSDDKVTVGSRARVTATAATAAEKDVAEKDAVQAMETDGDVAPVPAKAPSGAQSLAAKLSANLAAKRKASEPADQSGASDRTKPRR